MDTFRAAAKSLGHSIDSTLAPYDPASFTVSSVEPVSMTTTSSKQRQTGARLRGRFLASFLAIMARVNFIRLLFFISIQIRQHLQNQVFRFLQPFHGFPGVRILGQPGQDHAQDRIGPPVLGQGFGAGFDLEAHHH